MTLSIKSAVTQGAHTMPSNTGKPRMISVGHCYPASFVHHSSQRRSVALFIWPTLAGDLSGATLHDGSLGALNFSLSSHTASRPLVQLKAQLFLASTQELTWPQLTVQEGAQGACGGSR